MIVNLKENKEIIRQIKLGDMREIEGLVTKYKSKLFGYIYRMNPDLEEARDLYQEVWLRVIRKIDSYNDEYPFSVWIFTIAKNLVIDKNRRKRKFINEEYHDTYNFAEKYESNLENLSDDGNNLKRKLEEAITNLPSKHREVLILRYFNGESEENTARILSCEKGTVKSRLHYAIKSLRRVMVNK